MYTIFVIDHLMIFIHIAVKGIYIYKNTDGVDIRMLDNEINNKYSAYW